MSKLVENRKMKLLQGRQTQVAVWGLQKDFGIDVEKRPIFVNNNCAMSQHMGQAKLIEGATHHITLT